MSKARLVITAVTVEKRPVSEVAKSYGVARSWVYALLARYQAEGEAAFEPRSRRPKTSPTAISDDTADLIIRLRKELSGQGLDAGPQTIAWHLEQHHQLNVSAATVSRYLSRAGMVTPNPAKRPKSSYIRFEADMPNECWQSDFTHYPLASGTDTEVLTWLDDHSRYALSVTAHARVTGPIVLLAFRAACGAHGVPASTLTDNGMVFTTRLSGGKGGRNALEHELRRLGITQKNGKPNHPQTQGKVERFQQTMKNWLRAQPDQPDTLAGLQPLLDAFTGIYNTQRPHRSLTGRATPADAYAARPKAQPGDRSGAPRVWWRLDSPQMLLSGWAVVFHGTAAWRNHGLIIFPFLFYRTSVQLPRLVAGCARQAAPGGAGISSSGTPHCAAGSPGWSRVTLQRHRLRRRRRP